MWYEHKIGDMLSDIALTLIFSLAICGGTIGHWKNDLKKPKAGSEGKHPSVEAERRFIGDDFIPADSEQGGLPRTRKKRVVYGEFVNESDYLFIVNIFSRDYRRKCAGTLISPRLVLTAAHCLEHELGYIRVNLPDTYFGRYYKIERTIPHPGYQFPRYADVENTVHDIGLLVLENSIPNAQTVQLIPPNHDGDFTTARLYGWGMTEAGSTTQQLRGVTLTIMSSSESEKYYSIVDGRICAGGQNGNMGNGDSGGPLMWNECQIGIASVGLRQPCPDDVPSAFTRISAYRNWIDEQIRSIQSEPEPHQDLLFGGSQGFWRVALEDALNSCCCLSFKPKM